MKPFYILLSCFAFGLSSLSSATEYDKFVVSGQLSPRSNEAQLPTENGSLAPVTEEAGKAFNDRQCGVFSCKNESLKIQTGKQTFAFPLVKSDYHELRGLRIDRDYLFPLTFVTKDKKHQLYLSHQSQPLSAKHVHRVVPASCSTDCVDGYNYCESPDSFGNCALGWSHYVCTSYAEHCTPSYDICEKITTTAQKISIDIKNPQQAVLATFTTDAQTMTDAEKAPMQLCFQ